MKKNLFSIGEISRIKGITIKALRFYERIGLLKPYYIDPSTHYRYYSTDQFLQMDIIKALRLIGISPKDLKGLFDQKDIKAFPHYLASQRAAAEQRIIELQETIRRIDAAQEYIQHSIATIKKRDIYERVIPDRHVITSEFEVIDGLLDPAEWLDRLLLSYSRLSHVMEENNFMDAYETGIIFLPDSNRLFRPAKIYSRVLTDDRTNLSMTSVLEGGRYICVCFNRENAVKQQKKLMSYLEKHMLTPASIVQVDLLNETIEVESGYCELQVKII